MFLNSNKPPREVLKPTGGWPHGKQVSQARERDCSPDRRP
jgi:hypothetical protein